MKKKFYDCNGNFLFFSREMCQQTWINGLILALVVYKSLQMIGLLYCFVNECIQKMKISLFCKRLYTSAKPLIYNLKVNYVLLL